MSQVYGVPSRADCTPFAAPVDERQKRSVRLLEIFLPGEVMEHRHAGNIGRLRDLVHPHIVKAALHEKARGHIGDPLPCRETLQKRNMLLGLG